MRSEDGYYAEEINIDGDDVWLPVGRLDIDLLDLDALEDTLRKNDIPVEVRTELLSASKIAMVRGSKSAKASFFSPDLVVNTNSSGSTTTTYYTYSGHKMKSVRVYYSGISTGWEYISTGVKTKDIADDIASFILSAVGINFKTISIIATGITLFQAFLNDHGSIAGGHRDDYLQIRLIYDDIKQWTYAQNGDEWILGLCTEQVTVTKVGSEQYYYNTLSGTGHTTTTDRAVNVVQKSEHFDSPWATAWQWLSTPLTEWIYWKVGSKTFYF